MSYLTTLVRTQLAQSGLELTDDAVTQKVALISQPFATPGDAGGGGLPLGTILAIAGGALAIGAIVVFLVMRRRKQAALEAEAESIEPPKVELPTIDLDHVTNESQMRKQLEQFAKRKPDDFVNLLRTWLVDE